jgi:hypothetical protein
LRKACVRTACPLQNEYLIADRHTDARVGIDFAAEYAERQVLDRKIRSRVVGGSNKAAARRIVGFVESMRHDLTSRLSSGR